MKEIPLGSRKYPGHVSLIDDGDYETVSEYPHWTAIKVTNSDTLYAVCRNPRDKKLIYMHRLIMGDSHPHVDHINGDGLDNRRENLRPATTSQNCANRRKKANASSHFLGVCLSRGRWVASITKNRKQHYLGSYANEEDAARAYDKAARELHGEFANPNFPDEMTSAA